MSHEINLKVVIEADTKEAAEEIVTRWANDMQRAGNLQSFRKENWECNPTVQALRTIQTFSRKVRNKVSPAGLKHIRGIDTCVRKGLKGVPLYVMETTCL